MFIYIVLVPGNLHTHRKNAIGNSEGGEGFSKAKSFKGKYEMKVEFPEGIQSREVVGYQYFLKQRMCTVVHLK